MKLSIIIPTCRRPKFLERCLGKFAEQNRDLVQIIVSDDGRDSETEQITRKFGAQYLPGPRRGPAANRNFGAAVAVGEWIAFVDDDCVPAANYIASALKACQPHLEIVEGKTVCPDKADSPFIEIVENLHGGAFWSCNLLVRRDTFERLGGFDEQFQEAGGEDMEFAWRIREQGLKAHFAPDILVEHPSRAVGLKALWKRALMIKWLSLYQIRTGQADTWLGLIINRVLNLARVTYRRLLSTRTDYWRRPLFQAIWDLVTFPILLPYILYWHGRFRREAACK